MHPSQLQPWLEDRFADLKALDGVQTPRFDARVRPAAQSRRFGIWSAVAATIVFGVAIAFIVTLSNRKSSPVAKATNNAIPECPLVSWQSPTNALLEPTNHWPGASEF